MESTWSSHGPCRSYVHGPRAQTEYVQGRPVSAEDSVAGGVEVRHFGDLCSRLHGNVLRSQHSLRQFEIAQAISNCL